MFKYLKPSLRAWLCGLALIGGAFLSAAAHAQGGKGIQIGVLPNVSTLVLLKNYQPLRTYLEQASGAPVEISTAPDFKAFHERALSGDYALFVTAANLGRVAQLAGKAQAVAIYEPTIPAVVAILKDKPPASIQDLKGKSLALANPQSLVALRGIAWLSQQGLQAGSDFAIAHARNEDSLGNLLLSGEAPFAIMSMGEFRQANTALRDRLAVLTTFAQVPGFWVMADARLGASDVERWRRLLLAFPATELGRQFAELAGVKAIRELTEADQRALDPYVDATRKGLAGVP